MAGHFEDGVDRFLLSRADKRAGIYDDDVGIFGVWREFGSRLGEHAHHDLAVDEVLGQPRLTNPTLAGAVGPAVNTFVLMGTGSDQHIEINDQNAQALSRSVGNRSPRF